MVRSKAFWRINARVTGRVLFLLYVVGLIYFMFFCEALGRTETAEELQYNLIPLMEIRRFWIYWNVVGLGSAVFNILGNVVAFIPFGLFLPMAWPRFRSAWITILMTFFTSLFIELLQLFSRRGSFDVDDLILNTLGGVIGYICFYILRKVRREQIGII